MCVCVRVCAFVCLVGRNVDFETPTDESIALTPINAHQSLLPQIVNTGVRAVTRTDGHGVGCSFRPAQEAVDMVAPYMTKRVYTVSYEDICLLLAKVNSVRSPFRVGEGFEPVLDYQLHMR